MTARDASLRRNGTVRPDYRHAPKLARPASTVGLGDAVLKWYDIAPPGRAGARRECARLRDAGSPRPRASASSGSATRSGFVILHRCGDGFHFLLVSTWQNDNELWETVWAKDGDDDPEFHPWPIDGSHRPTFCVWELGAVAHERLAWSHYLLSDRGDDGEARRTSATLRGARCEPALLDESPAGRGRGPKGAVSRTTGLAVSVRRSARGRSESSKRRPGGSHDTNVRRTQDGRREVADLIREIQQLTAERRRLAARGADGVELDTNEREIDELRWLLADAARRAASDGPARPRP